MVSVAAAGAAACWVSVYVSARAFTAAAVAVSSDTVPEISASISRSSAVDCEFTCERAFLLFLREVLVKLLGTDKVLLGALMRFWCIAAAGGSVTAKLFLDEELDADEEKNLSMLTIFLRKPH